MAENIQQVSDNLKGKPMSTATILIALAKSSLLHDKSISDKDPLVRKTTALNAKTASLLQDVTANSKNLKSIFSMLKESLHSLGQDALQQKFQPLEVDFHDMSKLQQQLHKDTASFIKEQQKQLSDMQKSKKSPAETKQILDDLSKKQRDLSKDIGRLNINEQNLQQKLNSMHKQAYESALASTGKPPEGLKRPEAP